MKYKKTTLPNGLRIITVPTKGNPAVTVMTVVETGSDYESKDINGLSHFLEHMCFKGTTNRSSALEITKELDGLGARTNAFTGEELTGYYAKVEKKHFKKILEVISDLYLNPTFPSVDLEKEKGVILQEMSMYEDLPQHKVSEIYKKLMYGDSAYGRTILGLSENIKGFKREDFVAYREKHYVAKATVVIVAGDFKEKAIIAEINKRFKGISTEKKHSKDKFKESQSSPNLSIHHKKTDQTHIIMGFRAFSAKDKRNTTMTVAASVLGGGMSSRLFQKLREEMGVCYYVRSGIDDYSNRGSFVISTGVDKKRTEEVIKVLLEECKKLKNELVSKEELQKTKDYIIGNLYMGLETTDSLADFYVGQEIIQGKIKTPQEIEKEIRKITAEDIQKVVKEIFQNKNLNLAIVGEVKDSNKIKKALSI